MVRIKICGITNLEDALAAVEFGADALGFNFYHKSPRYIAPDAASEIISKLPSGIMKVGVFVNSSLAELDQFYSQSSVVYIQLHGEESPPFVQRVTEYTGAIIIKAIRVSQNFDPQDALEYDAEYFLLDTSSSTAFGGTGETFDWDAALRFKEFGRNFFLAGGLTPANVAGAIRHVRPFGVDVCSGVESIKGKKDHNKLEEFIRNARGAI